MLGNKHLHSCFTVTGNDAACTYSIGAFMHAMHFIWHSNAPPECTTALHILPCALWGAAACPKFFLFVVEVHYSPFTLNGVVNNAPQYVCCNTLQSSATLLGITQGYHQLQWPRCSELRNDNHVNSGACVHKCLTQVRPH